MEHHPPSHLSAPSVAIFKSHLKTYFLFLHVVCFGLFWLYCLVPFVSFGESALQMLCIFIIINPNLPTGVVGKKGRVGKKFARPAAPGRKLGTYHVLDECPHSSFTSRRLFRQASLLVPIDRLRQLHDTTCSVFWR